VKLRILCKSKIHRATITGADVDYIGSIGIDRSLLGLADILPGEKVSVWNLNNGNRIETYAIDLPEGSGEVAVNGAAARLFHVGDLVIIAAFAVTDEAIEPRMLAVDERNRFVRFLGDGAPAELAAAGECP
jgi:aspartate 1-decarboxylase